MRIRVKVIPHSKVCTITEGDVLIVKLKERAEDGKANVALIKLLKKHFNFKEIDCYNDILFLIL